MGYSYVENRVGFARRAVIDASSTTTDGGVLVYENDGKMYWRVPSEVDMSTVPVGGERVHFHSPQWVRFVDVYRPKHDEYYWKFQIEEHGKRPFFAYLPVVNNGHSRDLTRRLLETPPEQLPDAITVEFLSELSRFLT